MSVFCKLIPRGETARILGSHPRGPGSTPGVGIVLIPFRYEGFYHLLFFYWFLRERTANHAGRRIAKQEQAKYVAHSQFT